MMKLFRLLARRPDRRTTHRPVLESLEDRKLLTVAGDVSTSLLAPVENLVGAAQTRQTYQVDGSGLTAAVIDTGVNYQNANLGGGFGAGHKVVAGYDFGDGDAVPMAVNQHGTAVAGLLAGNDPTHQGVAPGANIVALKVFGDDGSSDFSKIANALQWVVDHHDEYNISVVNISISDGGNYSFNWFQFDAGIGQRMASLVHQLAQANIPVVTATGNSFHGTQGQGFPSIIAESISVAGSDPSDQFLGDTQRLGSAQGGASATDLASPGSGLVGPAAGNTYNSVTGTSFAAPLVSGSILLLQQLYESRFGSLPTVDQIDGWLKSGAETITDSVTGISMGRLDVLKSASLVPGAPSQGGGTTDPGTGSNDPPPVSMTTTSLNGQATGTVDSSSSDNPFNNVGSLFGNGATVTNSQSFTGAHIPNQASLTVNGVYQGVVDSHSDANPFAHFGTEFGTDGNVVTVQTWTNSRGTAATAGNPIPVGTVGVRIRRRAMLAHARHNVVQTHPGGPTRFQRFANHPTGR
jgi:subtilisin family serine protease